MLRFFVLSYIFCIFVEVMDTIYFSRKTRKSCDDALEISDILTPTGESFRRPHIKNTFPVYYGRWWDVLEKNTPLKIEETCRLVRIGRLKTILG